MTKRSARNIPLAELVANPANIRTDVGDVTELARSIHARGVLNPLLVTEDPLMRGWLLLAGHRRLAAARQAEFHAVPCFIHHDVGGDQVEQTVLMLVENVQRKNLTPVEKAKAYGRLRDKHGLTASQIARRTGIHVSTITTHLALLDMDEKSLELVQAGEVTAGAAIAAVREQRQETRKANGTPARGRPVVFEPYHFSWHHLLARPVFDLCTHTTRSKVGGVGCGQCWERVIRENEQRHGPEAEPSRAEPSRAEDTTAPPTTKPSSYAASTATGTSA
jgi:ParB family chromosome partitioning protein